ncbi:MAG: serine/threonine-protein kinase [Jatrophihabitantaceae bacterium]
MTDTEPLIIAGRYRLVTALATGGMGVVWKGWDERLQRPVAIKQLRVQPGLSPAEAATARDRAMREARNTARLHHPHAVPVYDVVEQDGEPCLIMEFLPSISLQEAIRERGTLPPVEVARIGSEVAQALTAAHGAGIVHRDVKPGNVLLAEDGTSKLTDFGISHALGDVALTQTGMLTGTPAYLAPEVARGQPANFASDVFSLGSTLYTASEGVPPFGQDANAMAVLHRVASGRLRPPEQGGPLTALLVRMLTTDPAARPTMTEVTRSLAALHAQTTGAQTASAEAASLRTAELDLPQAPLPRTFFDSDTTPDVRPARGPALRGPRRRGGLTAALLTSAVLIAALVGAIVLIRSYSGSTGSDTSKPPIAGSTTRGTSAALKSSQARSSTASSGRTSSTSPAAATAAQLAQAITDYYQVVPGNLQEGWSRLTASYQQYPSGGFSGYQEFWSQFTRATATNVIGRAPDTVEATITYYKKSGGTPSMERLRFRLVMSGGILKINDTQRV